MASNHPWSLQTYFHNEVGKLARCCLWAQDARILGRHTLEEPNPTSKHLFLPDTAGKMNMLFSGFCVGRVALSNWRGCKLWRLVKGWLADCCQWSRSHRWCHRHRRCRLDSCQWGHLKHRWRSWCWRVGYARWRGWRCLGGWDHRKHQTPWLVFLVPHQVVLEHAGLADHHLEGVEHIVDHCNGASISGSLSSLTVRRPKQVRSHLLDLWRYLWTSMDLCALCHPRRRPPRYVRRTPPEDALILHVYAPTGQNFMINSWCRRIVMPLWHLAVAGVEVILLAREAANRASLIWQQSRRETVTALSALKLKLRHCQRRWCHPA